MLRKVLFGGLLAVCSAFVNWRNCSAPDQITRPCTFFEEGYSGVCLCPGKGKRVEFTLNVIEHPVNNVPGEFFSPRSGPVWCGFLFR
jgi:hypothetical protein